VISPVGFTTSKVILHPEFFFQEGPRRSVRSFERNAPPYGEQSRCPLPLLFSPRSSNNRRALSVQDHHALLTLPPLSPVPPTLGHPHTVFHEYGLAQTGYQPRSRSPDGPFRQTPVRPQQKS